MPQPTSDLSHHIPGLYLLIDSRKDEGSNGLVDKFIISKESLKEFCNKMVPSSFKSFSDVNYSALNSVSVNLVGEFYMSPGIYLLVIPPLSLGLVIHWPEPGCYEENISSQTKKKTTKLHRYLTKLTDHQLCLMSESDLEFFIRNLEDEGEDEDFKILPGFQIYLPQRMISDIRYGYPLQPTVVESVTSQTLITKKKFTSTSQMIKNTLNTENRKFKEDFGRRLNGYALRISKNMSFKSLEMLIKNGLPEMEKELLGPYRKGLEDVRTQIELKKAQERDSIKEDAEIFTKHVWKKLRQEYNELELLIKESTNNLTTQQVHDDETLKQSVENIKLKYPAKCDQIEDALKINSKEWKKLKKRYMFVNIFIQDIFSENISMGKDGDAQSNDVRQSMCQAVFDMFMDKELDYHKLIKKYYFRGPDQSLLSFIFAIVNNITRNYDSKVNLAVNHAEALVNTTPDKKFINEITSMEFESLFKQKHEIIDVFLKEYERWKKATFPGNIKEIVPKYDRYYMKEVNEKFNSEYLRYKKKIEEEEFNRICKEIENKFPKGPILRILNLYENDIYNIKDFIKYYVSYEIEIIQPDQLKVTIHQTSIDDEDNFRLSEDEFHIPAPKFNNQYSGDIGSSFQINPETHEIRNISQFENKFFLALWNNKENRLEMYFDTASRLSSSIQSNPFKILYPNKSTLISVNEPKGLIGFYDISSVVLNVYAFDEKFYTIIPRATNVQLNLWYNHMVPEIQHFFFIKDTEDICFIEKNGRSRIYMIALNLFRPGSSQLPPESSKVLSTPDGACIVAFTKDTVLEQENENNDADSNTEKADGYNPENQIEIIKAHVFFCANFGSPAIILMPKNMQFVEHFQFSYIKKQQIHLTTLDVVNGQFCSLITKITLEKSMEKVRILSSDYQNDSYSFLEGMDTRFSKNVLVGESIVVQNEKRCILEIQSNTRLKIAGTFSNIADLDSWMDFRIEPKTNINSFINVYQYMFEKYPIDSCIDTEQNKSLSLTITLDLSSRNVEDYEERFRDYFEELKRSTKKPASSLKKFKIGNRKLTLIKTVFGAAFNIKIFTLDVMTFSELNIDDPDFQENKFTSLKELKRMLEKQEAKYTNARTFLQNTKIIMAKIKTCDWGSLDDNLVQIRVSTLKKLLQTAISIGVEEKNTTIVNLMNHDTGTKIDDPVIELPEILKDFGNSREILSDEDILLFEENTDFVRLSADLRTLEDKRNCQKVCAKEIGHEDSEHICQSKRHYCGKPCSLSTCTQKGNYQCPNKCITASEEEHDVHRCENETCPIQCPISGRCQSNDHFHAYSEIYVIGHFCGQEHQCPEYCEEPGICRVLTESQRQEETYQGKISKTVITFTKYIQLSERLRCYKKIPPNKFKHEGRHSHSQDINSFHFCDAKCQYCEYYCILPYGHTQSLHETKHGNMTQTEFTTGDQNFEIGAVYSAIYAFMKARLACQSGQPQRQAANKDTISLILFDHEVIVPFENHVLTDADVLLNHMIKHRARGGRDFNLAIQKAGFLINQYYDANKKSIIIFLSDGDASVPHDQLRLICEYNKKRGNPLFLYTVLLANQSESSSLREMAEIAQKYQPPNSSASSLRCQYNNVMTEINLVTTFTGVAESI
ncbi:11945_t:CDS:10 [Acaulospora morrowiae]|uniref:11945_t:CDS:1 n=1 Tax=Acaulospora morrowiae TaxID=94023 RepID=A0A9N9AEJ8_9GLOM|nr:11945_t:CDS:10 [Acaulospora morrowiae]